MEDTIEKLNHLYFLYKQRGYDVSIVTSSDYCRLVVKNIPLLTNWRVKNVPLVVVAELEEGAQVIRTRCPASKLPDLLQQLKLVDINGE